MFNYNSKYFVTWCYMVIYMAYTLIITKWLNKIIYMIQYFKMSEFTIQIESVNSMFAAS